MTDPSEAREGHQEKQLLDRWNYSGLPSVGAFNHAVDCANACYQVKERTLAALAAAREEVDKLRAALVQAEQREAELQEKLARVDDSQYAAPLATASKNEVIR